MKTLSQHPSAIQSRKDRAAWTPEQKARADAKKAEHRRNNKPRYAELKRLQRLRWTDEQRARDKEVKAAWFQANKEKVYAQKNVLRKAMSPEQIQVIRVQTKAWILRNRKELRNYKEQQGCLDCGYDRAVALDFDHRDITTKSFSISAGASSYGMKRLWEEVAKCDVVCKNCHAIRTAKTFKWVV